MAARTNYMMPMGGNALVGPALYLHPAHVEKGGRQEPLPVSGHVPREEVAPLSAHKDHSGAALCKARFEALPWLGVANNELVAVWPDSDEVACRIVLLFREVAMGFNRRFGAPLITLASGFAGQAWMLLVDGDVAAGRQVLARLAQSGAIRVDFSETYAIERTSLGKGSNAAVFGLIEKHPRSVSTCAHIVAKVPLRGYDDDGDEVPEEMVREIRMLTAVQGHPNVVKFYGLFHSAESSGEDLQHTKWALLLERCNSGDLFETLARCQVSEHLALHILQGLLSALVHTHQQEIVHRDVKPENVLIASDGRALLSDYGIASHLRDFKEMGRHCGSPGYAAPEIILGKCYGAKVDCFSAGSLLYFILASKVPFDGPTSAVMLQRTLHHEIDFSEDPRFEHVSDACKDLILRLLLKNPTLRPSSADALKHPFLAQECSPDVGKLFAKHSSTKSSESQQRRAMDVPRGASTGSQAAMADPQTPQHGSSKTRTSAMHHIFKFRDPTAKSDHRAFSNLPGLWAPWRTSSRSQANDNQGPEHRITMDERLLNRRSNPHSDGGASNDDAAGGSTQVSGYLSRGMMWLQGSKAKHAGHSYRQTGSFDGAGEAMRDTPRSSATSQHDGFAPTDREQSLKSTRTATTDASGASSMRSDCRSPKTGSWMSSRATGSSSSASGSRASAATPARPAPPKRLSWREDTGSSAASHGAASSSFDSAQATEHGIVSNAARDAPLAPIVPRAPAAPAPHGAGGTRRPVGHQRRLVMPPADEEMSF